MEVEVKELPKSRAEIRVKLSGEEFSPYFSISSKKISKNLNIPGFRPGKTPQNILEEKIGREKILDEAANIALNTIFPKIVQERKLEVIGRPQAEIQKLSKDEMKALIKICIFPKVQLPPWREIAKKEIRGKVEVKKGEEKDSLKYLQKSRAKITRKNTPSEKGDLINIDYEIRRSGVKIENGDIKNQKFILGEGKLLPGFEEKLIGSREKEEKSFSLIVPDDFWKKELRGANLDFKVRINEIFKMELPKINDEWAKSLGEFNSLNDLEKSLLDGIKMEKEDVERKRWENSVLDKIAKKAKMEVPDIMINNERDQMIESFKVRVEETGISFQNYLTQLKKSMEDLGKDFLLEAERRVKIFISIYQIAKEEKIQVSDKELDEKINEVLNKSPLFKRDLQDKEKETNFKNYLRENILQSKVVELLSLEARKK